MSEVLFHGLKPEVECPCTSADCPKFATSLLKGTGHIRNCPDTCPRCRGKRNRERGKRAEREMRRKVGATVATTMHAAVGEEAWSHALFRDECKAGAQVGPIATRFLKAERQADQNRRIGDNRDFRYLARPDGMPGGLVIVRGSVWDAVIEPALRAYHGYEEAS